MMTERLLPYQYFRNEVEPGLTSFGGLPLYMDMAIASGLCAEVKKRLNTKKRGWTDAQILMALILLNIAGGDSVDDIERLEIDEGLKTLLSKIETHGMTRKERRAYERRWSKQKQRSFPSASPIRRYLEEFHNEAEESKRIEGKAFIPAKNELLTALCEINSTLINFMQEKHPCKIATLDQDATLCYTNKSTAHFSYKKERAYQPFNTYWFEQGMVIHSEFRDGNVNAGFEQLRLLKESLSSLPKGVEKVYLRSDAAGYQQELLQYCAKGSSPRFGVIEFAITARVSKSFKEAILGIPENSWRPLYKEDEAGNVIKSNQEWAEVCFVPSWAGHSMKEPDYRYIAIRERMLFQTSLPGMEPEELNLPFQTMDMNESKYKIFGIVTNRDIPGNDLINWYRKRCGDSEKIHSVEKGDLAGGQFPSNKFGANAAWWQIMIMSFNLNRLMKTLVLPESLKKKRMKGLRFHIICVAARVIKHAKRLFIRIGASLDTARMIYKIRQNIAELAKPPPLLAT